MRILFLTHRLPYAPNRGDRIRAHYLLRLLARTHEVHLVSLIHDAEEMDHVKDLRGLVASVTGIRVPRVSNLVSAAWALPGPRPLTHVLLHSPAMRKALEQSVAGARPDMVIAYCSGMARYALESPLNQFPFVLDMVDVDSEKWAALAEASVPPKKWIYRREASRLRAFERRAVQRARATVVVSNRERAALDRVFVGHNAVVVPNGVDVTSFAERRAIHGDRRVIFCGVFDYSPNEAGALWMASEVWPLVTRAIPGAQMDLVGMNPTRAVRALESNRSIHVTGAVPDVRRYLSQAAVSAAPVWLARGVQNKVLEAVAAGLPCVVTPPVFEGLPSEVQSACTVGGDAAAFADAIVTLLKATPAERLEIADRADLSRLEWDAQLRPFLNLLATPGTDANRGGR